MEFYPNSLHIISPERQLPSPFRYIVHNSLPERILNSSFEILGVALRDHTASFCSLLFCLWNPSRDSLNSVLIL